MNYNHIASERQGDPATTNPFAPSLVQALVLARL